VAAGYESLGDKADLFGELAIYLNYSLRDNVLRMGGLYHALSRAACHQSGKQADEDIQSHLDSSSHSF
jgi:hypothetical protein